MRPTVLVVGAGSMGCLLAARLSVAADVILQTGWRQRREAIARDGIVLTSGNESQVATVTTVESAEGLGPAFVFLCAKAQSLGEAAKRVDRLRPGAFIAIQNGVGHLDSLPALLPGRPLIFAATYQGATFEGLNRIRQGADGPTFLWAPDPSAAEVAANVAQLMTAAGMATEMVSGPERMWAKLAVTCGINATCAVLGVPVRGLSQSPSGWRVAEAAVREAAAVARANGVPLDEEPLMDEARAALRHASGNVPSILQDLRAGRRTEVESINGYIANAGETLGLAVPVNWTLHGLIRGLEEVSSRAPQKEY